MPRFQPPNLGLAASAAALRAEGRRRADADAGLNEVARLENEAAGVDRADGNAAGRDGECTESQQVALEFSREQDVLRHAELAL